MSLGALVQRDFVLEPDSLALATECGNLDARVPQLRTAVDALQRSDTWIYLDGGHSTWHRPAEQADLTPAGIRRNQINDLNPRFENLR